MANIKNLNILVLHHIDRDGYMAAACIEEYHYFEKDDNSTRKYVPVNYTQSIKDIITDDNESMVDLFDCADIVFLVDYSISTKENAEFIIKYADKVIWLDHHLSSINMIKEYPELKSISGLRIVGMSGALLTWIYVNGASNSFDTDIQNIYDPSEVFAFIEVKNIFVPTLIKYTHCYDVWDFDSVPDVEDFNFGYSTLNVEEMASHLYYGRDNERNPVVSAAIRNGRIIKNYVVEENTNIIKNIGIPFTLEYEDKKYSALLCNMPKPSSLKFGQYAFEYDILIPFWYEKKGGYSYSLYKGNYCSNLGLDVSAIAKMFGGGGHKNAAGFYLPATYKQLRPTSNSTINIKDFYNEVMFY